MSKRNSDMYELWGCHEGKDAIITSWIDPSLENLHQLFWYAVACMKHSTFHPEGWDNVEVLQVIRVTPGTP